MSIQIRKGTIPTNEQMKYLIDQSHKRSKEYGIDRENRKQDHEKLSEVKLEEKRFENKEILEVIDATIKEFYELMSSDDFLVALADGDGYILLQEGGETITKLSEERNCSPGFRWTEEDVGTTAISLCLKEQMPVQLNDKDHYCRQAHGFTSSAAPIWGHQGVLQAVLVVYGDASLVHPHTLIMITSAARSVERHMRLKRRNTDLTINSGFLDNVIEAAGTGLLTLNNKLIIRRMNHQAKQILQSGDLVGQPVSVLGDLQLDMDSIFENPQIWKNRECHIQDGKRDIHFLYSAQPVLSKDDRPLGTVLNITEFSNIRKLVDKISGTKPFFTFDSLLGSSPAFMEAISLARRASNSDTTVLLLGETGTGKELFAQAIHNGLDQADKPFIPINCGAIPGELLESELFGYVEGAFTGAQRGGRSGKFILANGGTILLDEIGDMPHDMQVKLLRVLQTGEVHPVGAQKSLQTNARIIASTHVNLSNAVEQNRFRQDLYYRLNILQIRIPALRERGREDIRILANYFLKKSNPLFQFTADAMDTLVTYNWPGNVRELENTIQRALHVCRKNKITAKDLGIANTPQTSLKNSFGTIQQMEEKMITDALLENNSNMVQTSRQLGISRATLYRKVKQYGLD